MHGIKNKGLITVKSSVEEGSGAGSEEGRVEQALKEVADERQGGLGKERAQERTHRLRCRAMNSWRRGQLDSTQSPTSISLVFPLWTMDESSSLAASSAVFPCK